MANLVHLILECTSMLLSNDAVIENYFAPYLLNYKEYFFLLQMGLWSLPVAATTSSSCGSRTSARTSPVEPRNLLPKPSGPIRFVWLIFFASWVEVQSCLFAFKAPWRVTGWLLKETYGSRSLSWARNGPLTVICLTFPCGTGYAHKTIVVINSFFKFEICESAILPAKKIFLTENNIK